MTCHLGKGGSVRQHIGNAGTKAMACVGHIVLSPSRQVKRDKELEELKERLHSLFGPGESVEVTARKRIGFTAWYSVT